MELGGVVSFEQGRHLHHGALGSREMARLPLLLPEAEPRGEVEHERERVLADALADRGVRLPVARCLVQAGAEGDGLAVHVEVFDPVRGVRRHGSPPVGCCDPTGQHEACHRGRTPQRRENSSSRGGSEPRIPVGRFMAAHPLVPAGTASRIAPGRTGQNPFRCTRTTGFDAHSPRHPYARALRRRRHRQPAIVLLSKPPSGRCPSSRRGVGRPPVRARGRSAWPAAGRASPRETSPRNRG